MFVCLRGWFAAKNKDSFCIIIIFASVAMIMQPVVAGMPRVDPWASPAQINPALCLTEGGRQP